MNLIAHPGFQAIQKLLAPLVRWCVSMGIGHGQLSRLSKPLFYQAARLELKAKGQKITDSALSLASGLHKGDIDRFNQQLAQGVAFAPDVGIDRINPASQVIARWITQGLSPRLPLRGPNSFDALVKALHREEGAPQLSTRLILKELERRRLVALDDRQGVNLLSEVGLPAIDQEEAVKHFVGAVRDHLLACLHNLDASQSEHLFLEQSLNVDGLQPASAALLHKAAREWWAQALKALGNQAITLSEADEPLGGNQRLRIGIYVYSQPKNRAEPGSALPNPSDPLSNLT